MSTTVDAEGGFIVKAEMTCMIQHGSLSLQQKRHMS